MKFRRILTALLLASLVLTSAACAADSGNSDAETTAAVTSAETTVAEEEGYAYGDTNFDGYSFRVMNIDEQFGCHIRVDIETQTGDILDDAMYTRNRMVEEKLGIKISEVVIGGGAVYNAGQIDLCEKFIENIMAGDDVCDAAYMPVYFKPSVVTDGYVLDLLDIPELNVYSEYWDAAVNETLTLGDSLYTAAGPLNLMALDLTWALLFNENMMDDHGLDYPYQLVRDGEWTLDKFGEYVTVPISLNGDESFELDSDGSCVYGIAGHTHSPVVMLYSAGVDQAEKSGNSLKLTMGGERLYSALEAIAAVCKTGNGSIFYNNGGLEYPYGYMSMFGADRAMFMTCEMKSALEERAMESTFGLVPMPKLDDSQEEYRSYVAYNTAFLVIPTTQKNTARAGFILDALNYESYIDTLPIYYDVTLSQKGLRNEESIEMLELIRENRGADLMAVYSITADITNSFTYMFVSGGGDVGGAASTVESGMSAANVKLDELIASLAD